MQPDTDLIALRTKMERSKMNNQPQWLRNLLHPLLRAVLRLTRVAAGIKVAKGNVHIPKRPGRRPIIYVLTHVGKDDQPVFAELKLDHYFVLSGDWESLHDRIEGKFSVLNGTLFFDMESKSERQEIVERVAEHLKTGHDLLCSMEAAWNLSPNELVSELFPGMIKAALQSNAVILLVGIERFHSKLFGINAADRYFDPADYRERYADERELLDAARADLRDVMADLKFQLYFHPYIRERIRCRRSELGDFRDYYTWFKADILKGWTFTEEDIRRKGYRSRQKPMYAWAFLRDKYASVRGKDKLVMLARDIKDASYPDEIREFLLGKWQEEQNC